MDADYAADGDNRRSISGFICMVHGNIISWFSKQQSIVAQSTTEAEYVAMADGLKDALYLKHIHDEILGQDIKIMVLEDNQGAIELLKNKKISSRTKHIDVRTHFIRDLYDSGLIDIEYCPSAENLADGLTKPLALAPFNQIFLRLLSSGDIELNSEPDPEDEN